MNLQSSCWEKVLSHLGNLRYFIVHYHWMLTFQIAGREWGMTLLKVYVRDGKSKPVVARQKSIFNPILNDSFEYLWLTTPITFSKNYWISILRQTTEHSSYSLVILSMGCGHVGHGRLCEDSEWYWLEKFNKSNFWVVTNK